MEASLYAALPAIAALYGRAAIDNLHDRVGEQEQLRGRRSDDEWVNGAWVRYMTWHGHHDGGELGIYSDQGPSFDYDLDGLQLGMDIWRRETDDGQRDHAGVYAALGRGSADVEHLRNVRAGRSTVDATSLGAYWTHFWSNGAYLDGVVQYTWYDAEARSPRGFDVNIDAKGYAVSLEGARPFVIDKVWVLEPQAQLTWQGFDSGQTSDGTAIIDFQDTNSLVGRIGLRLARTLTRETREGPTLTTGWLRANLSHEFLDNPTTAFVTEDGPVNFKADLSRTWAEANIGVTHQMSPNAALLTTFGYQWSLDDDIEAWSGKFGVRFNW